MKILKLLGLILVTVGLIIGISYIPDIKEMVFPPHRDDMIGQKVENEINKSWEYQMKYLYARLSEVDLTFAEVMALDSLVRAHPEYVNTLCLDADKIKAYNDVVSVILDWKTMKYTWPYTRFKGMVNASPLEQKHKDYVACLCDVNINRDIDAVKKYFQAHADDFQSFQDLEKLLESIISASAPKTTKPQKQSQRASSQPSPQGATNQGANGGSGSTQSGNPIINIKH